MTAQEELMELSDRLAKNHAKLNGQVDTGVRFLMPTDKQLIETAIMFNGGIIDKQKIADMVAMSEFILNRLYEHGDILKKSSKEI